MNSKVPTGDTIFADDTAATKRGSSSIAHFAVSAAKVTGAVDAKTKKKRVTVGPVGKGNGAKDAKAKKKLVAKAKPRGTNDAKTRKKPGVKVPPAKIPGASDMKIMRRRS